jgi:hypothetical protein
MYILMYTRLVEKVQSRHVRETYRNIISCRYEVTKKNTIACRLQDLAQEITVSHNLRQAYKTCLISLFTRKVSPFTGNIQVDMGHTVAQSVEALRYKPKGRGFDSRFVSMEFFIDIILLAALWPCG